MTSITTPPSGHASINGPLSAGEFDACTFYQTTSAWSAQRENIKIDDCIDNSNATKKRSLHFQETTSIFWIERTSNLSDDEIDASYYNSRDYSFFKDREKRLSRNFSNLSFVNGERRGDFLGVESRLQRFHRRERSRNAVYAVILEQELRQERNEDSDSLTDEDSIGIAQVYQRYTQESARLARERASVNASQIERTSSFSSYPTRYLMNEIDMGKWEGEEHSTERQSYLPWEVPTSNRNEQTRSRSTDMIIYATCFNPIYPGHYLDLFQYERHETSQKQSRDWHYEGELRLDDRRGSHESRREEAPIQQKIIRAQGYHEIEHCLQSPQELEVNQKAQPETISQEWMKDHKMWDTKGPRILPGLVVDTD